MKVFIDLTVDGTLESAISDAAELLYYLKRVQLHGSVDEFTNRMRVVEAFKIAGLGDLWGLGAEG